MPNFSFFKKRTVKTESRNSILNTLGAIDHYCVESLFDKNIKGSARQDLENISASVKKMKLTFGENAKQYTDDDCLDVAAHIEAIEKTLPGRSVQSVKDSFYRQLSSDDRQYVLSNQANIDVRSDDLLTYLPVRSLNSSRLSSSADLLSGSEGAPAVPPRPAYTFSM